MTRLSAQEIVELCRENPGWELVDGMLVRTYKFLDFVQAISFVNRVAELAEASAHHPDMDIRYNAVRLGLVTHDAGGISQRDASFIASMSAW